MGCSGAGCRVYLCVCVFVRRAEWSDAGRVRLPAAPDNWQRCVWGGGARCQVANDCLARIFLSIPCRVVASYLLLFIFLYFPYGASVDHFLVFIDASGSPLIELRNDL